MDTVDLKLAQDCEALAVSASEGVAFLSQLDGSRAPEADPHASGVLIGVRRSTSSATIAAAIYEGVAHTLAAIADLGGVDARLLEEETGGEIPAGAFVRLPNRHFYGSTVVDDVVIGPVRAEMLPMVRRNGHENRSRDVMNWSRNNYGVDRSHVERDIAELLAEDTWNSRPKRISKRSRSIATSKTPDESPLQT